MIDLEAIRKRKGEVFDMFDDYTTDVALMPGERMRTISADIDALLAELAERDKLDAIVDRCVESFSVLAKRGSALTTRCRRKMMTANTSS